MLTLKHWESDFFNKKIAQLSCLSSVSKSELSEYDIVEYVTDSLTLNISQKLTDLGFSLWESTVDFELNLKHKHQESENVIEYDFKSHGDVSFLVDGLFHESRFYQPPFDSDSGNRFYKQWLTNACNQTFDDQCYLAEVNEKAAGFITVKFEVEENYSRIGIIGLKSNFQNQGLGVQLFNKVINQSIDQGITNLFVKTQLSNYNSIKFYFTRLADIRTIEHRFILIN